MSKLLTVFGATGLQGGSLIDYVLKHPQLSTLFRVRAITRDISKQAAISLQERGVELVQADLSDPATLGTAVAGSETVFALTNYWDTGSAEVEIAQGKAIADASVTAGVRLLIWSSLPNVTKMTQGALTTVHHFDSKAAVEDYIRSLPITSSFFMPGWYMQNFLSWTSPEVQADGRMVLSQTWSLSTSIPMVDITDTGKFLTPILLNPKKYNGKRLTCTTAFYTPQQLVKDWTDVTGKKVEYEEISSIQKQGALTTEMYAQLKRGSSLINVWGYYGPTGKEDLEWTLAQMEEKPKTWKEFLADNGPWFESA